MNFDLENYKKVKLEVVEEIKATHDWEKTEGFIADGVISPAVFENEKFKILFILGESYGYDENGIVDIEDQLTDDILGVGSAKRQTSRKTPILAWSLLYSIANKKLIEWNDLPDFLIINEENKNELQNTLSKIAWINVKKASHHIDKFGDDATRQDHSEIYNSAIRNKTILKKQIDSIAPHLIIVCSNPVLDGLVDAKVLSGNIKKGKKLEMQENETGQFVIHVSHPSYYKDWGYQGIINTCNTIYKFLLKENVV